MISLSHHRLKAIVRRIKAEFYYVNIYVSNYKHYCREFGNTLQIWNALRWYLAWKNSLQEGRSPVEDRLPWIVFDAIEFLRQYVKPGMKVFEYGMGGSTLFFTDANCKVISIEHSPEWGRLLLKRVNSATDWNGIVVTPSEAMETVNHFGSAFPGFENSNFREYIEQIKYIPDETLNIVMVDGRARSAALAAAAVKVRPSGIIILDNAERPRYHAAINDLLKEGWIAKRFRGPGPYVKNEFWDTLFLIKPPIIET